MTEPPTKKRKSDKDSLDEEQAPNTRGAVKRVENVNDPTLLPQVSDKKNC